MPGPFTARRRPSSLLSHDWLAEFPQESPPQSRLLADAATREARYTAPASGARTTPSAVRVRKVGWVRRSILLTLSATALMMSASIAIGWVWMRLALVPVPPAEWPVSLPRLSALPAAVPNPTPVALTLGPQPTPEAVPEPAPAPPRAAAIPSTPARIPLPAARARSPVVAGDAAASGAGEVSAILSVLDRYRLAFSSLNPGSVRAVAFDHCRINVQGAQADAVCAGRVSLVTRPASQVRDIQSRRWTFTLLHGRDAWRIHTSQIDR